MKHTATPQALGDKFAEILKQSITPAAWDDMREQNAREQDMHVCHSHDTIDANVVMESACDALGVVVFNDDGISDATIDLWNAAWAHAKAAHLTAREQ